ncbi:centromere protein O-like isoform X3 [Mytilus trossulus]|uniref:centromere protein O-like isoform X3 n=1 Tax=Mytilus trossulus TaxID=6551 RepID=UPI003006F5D9
MCSVPFSEMDFLEVLEAKNLSRNTSDNTQLTVQRLVQLRRQRDALKIQLQTVETMISENNVSLEEDTPERDTEELTDVKSHHQELSTLMDCYRLTGFSVFSVDNTNIIFSYDTSHKGVCHETFYLEIQDLENENFKVMRHSFPGFIPVLDLEETLLKVDPRQFLLKLNDYLFAFITRREEAKIVQGKLNVDYSEPVDFIEIKIGNSSDILQLEFQLTYTDLLHTMPTKTRLTVIVNDDSEGHGVKPKEKLVKEWKNNLQTELLTDAIFDIMKDYKSLTSYHFDK